MHFTTYYFFFNVTAFGSHQALQSCLHIFSNGFTLFYLCVCVFMSVHVCACMCMYVQVPSEVRGGYWIPWSWSYRTL